MRIVILEDEFRAAQRLEKLILMLRPNSNIVQVIESVRDALVFFNSNTDYDLIFADIQLADGLSFEIFKQQEVKSPIIFTTAYDQYAIEAFKTNGIDYLLKPIEEDRLQQALNKLKKMQQPIELSQLANMVGSLSKADYKKRFMIKVGDKIKSIESRAVLAFYSLEKATFLYTFDKRSYVLDYSLDQLEDLLNPTNFFRISRKFIVSHIACKEIHVWSNSRLRLQIEGLNEEIIVARERVGEFKEWLDK